MNSARRRAVAVVAACCATLFSASALAVENGAIRIAPGWGGGELALPLMPGVSGTIGITHYEASRLRDNEGNTPQATVAPGLNAAVGARTRVTAVIPRIVWVSEQKLWGGNLGAVALIPYLHQSRSFTLTGQFPAAMPAPLAAGIQTQLDAQASMLGGRSGAWGDLEIGPLLSWVGDRTNAVFAPVVILPTGQYSATSTVNASAGNSTTFRPTLSVGYAGDGWDVGTRAAIAFNTRNRDTDVKSGSYLQADASLLKQFGGSMRAGVQGYVLQQLEGDDGPGVPAHGNKSRAFALGPAVSWSSSDATWLVDAKLLKEFGVRNRTEGRTAWVSISRRF
jgi:hypothetical protein